MVRLNMDVEILPKTGDILDETDRARRRLKMFFKQEFHNYIDNHLAGDFACQIIKRLDQERAVNEVSTLHGLNW